jgi:hypothetical protein
MSLMLPMVRFFTFLSISSFCWGSVTLVRACHEEYVRVVCEQHLKVTLSYG